MIGTRAVLKDFACINCRWSLLNAFVSTSGLSVRPLATACLPKPAVGYRPVSKHLRQLRSPHSRQIVSQTSQPAKSTEDESLQKSEDGESSENRPQQEDATPWYLEVEPPSQETTSSLLQRQRLPDLPPDPPPLLQPMLEHIFLELGIDDLMLFDLRKLDPPPALGANLIMIIGTARSEKHLHVSADRFCRYMKSTHQIAPYADGLLGRGELKLKLKRKARRARILSRVGSAETSNTDDGIRTGWICVTVSNIEDGKPVEEAVQLPEDYVGFGEAEHGARVVIQMLTQEKREELDLEDLWGKTLRRHERKQDRISRGIEEPDSEDEVGPSHTHNEVQTADFSPLSPSSSSMRPNPVSSEAYHSHNPALRGVRSFSTLNRRAFEAATTFEPGQIDQPSHPEINERAESTSVDSFLAALPRQCEKHVRHNADADAETFKLKAHFDFACSLSLKNARAILGRGPQDTKSTFFLRSYYSSLPLFPSAEQWSTRLSLVALGITVNAPNYTKQSLVRLFGKMQTSLFTIPASLYQQTIATLLQTNPPSDPALPPSISPLEIHAAVRMLHDMLRDRHPLPPPSPTSEDILSLLSLSLIHCKPPLRDPDLAFATALLPNPPPLSLDIAKLHACTLHKDFDTMWDIWRSYPASMRSRPPWLYLAMLEAVAATRHQRRCTEVVREAVESMEREEPPVKLEDVVEGVRACLVVAAPYLEGKEVELLEDEEQEDWKKKMAGGGEWERLWRACEKVKMEGGRWAREMDDD